MTNGFKRGNTKKMSFFKKYGFISKQIVSEEYQKHMNWKKQSGLTATPTVLFNGYELPNIYFQEVDKLLYFVDTKI